MQEQRRKMNVGMCFPKGLEKRVVLKLQQIVSNIYHDYKGLILRDGRVQKGHTLLRGCWGSVGMILASLGAGGKLLASCWRLWRVEPLSPSRYSHQRILTSNMSRVPGLEVNQSTDIENRSVQATDIHRLAEGWRCSGQAKQVTEPIVGSNPYWQDERRAFEYIYEAERLDASEWLGA
jgi:hypothetical protein